jgi:hypothetical protein
MPVHKFNAFDRDYDNAEKWTQIDKYVRIPDEEIVEGDWSKGLINLVYADDSLQSAPPYFHASVFHTEHDVTLDIGMHGNEFVYVVEGEMSYEIEGVLNVLKPGDLAYLDVKGKGIMKYKAPFTGLQVIFYGHAEPDRTDHASE